MNPAVSAFLPSQPPISSLTTILSEISYLVQQSTDILNSLPISYDANPQALLPCPFNPKHRIPPSSLFSHTLNCTSPVFLSHTFHYTCTLHCFLPPFASDLPFISNDSSEISISLEPYNGYVVPDNGSFYQGCPGCVTPSFRTPSYFSLPVVLAKQCLEFVRECTIEISIPIEFIRLLPSEIWAIQSELEAWEGSLPVAYSSRILRAFLNFRYCKLPMKQWIFSRSTTSGVAIDSALGDHVLLLIRLCFKVIGGEAFRLLDVMFSNEQYKIGKDDFLASSNSKFHCPMLLEVMKWLSMQLSILYGESQANIFSVDLLKECILESALHASFFPLEHEDSESEETVNSIVSIQQHTREHDKPDMNSEAVWIDTISIYQAGAAVAALQERSMVEEKIRYLRYSHMKSTYQRNIEHAYMSSFANEERIKRVEYKPVIEHDGLFWHRSSNQETNKLKTREEVLAEERDYKRRRISYRGKKQKRGTVEVMRDIIEEYMEEQARAVMCHMQESMNTVSKNYEEDVGVADVYVTEKFYGS